MMMTPAPGSLPLWLRSVHLWALAIYVAGFLLAPSEKFHDRWVYFLMAPLALWTVTRHAKTWLRDFTTRETGILAVICVLLSLPVFWGQGPDPVRELRHQLQDIILLGAVLVSVTVAARTPGFLETLLPRLLAVSGAVATVPVLYHLVTRNDSRAVSGWGTLSDNPNEAGLVVAIAVLATLWLWQQTRQRRWLLAVPLMLVALWFTGARSAVGALAAAALVAPLYARRHRALLLAGAVLAATAVAVLHQEIAHWVRIDTLNGRFPVWEVILDEVGQDWLLGAGIDGSTKIFIPSLGKDLEAHSLYFALYYRGGLLALCLFVGLTGRALWRGWRQQTPAAHLFSVLLIFGMISQLVEGVYPIKDPNQFWLYTWVPLLSLAHLAPDGHAVPAGASGMRGAAETT